jgi:post-segregation antitoxin (ccd killing protein)
MATKSPVSLTPVTPTPTDVRESVDAALHNISEVAQHAVDTLQAIDAMTRWLEESSKAREKEFGDKNVLLMEDVGHLRTAIDALVRRDEEYVWIAVEGSLQDVREALTQTGGAR